MAVAVTARSALGASTGTVGVAVLFAGLGSTVGPGVVTVAVLVTTVPAPARTPNVKSNERLSPGARAAMGQEMKDPPPPHGTGEGNQTRALGSKLAVRSTLLAGSGPW